MEEFESHPRQYFQWGKNENRNLIFYVIDSTFHVENTYGIYRVLEETWYNDQTYVSEEFDFGDSNMNSTFVVPDGDDLLVVAPYQRDSIHTSFHRETGVAVARYELRTMQLKALAHFNDWPGSSTYADCMCFQKATDGSLYMVYRELTPECTPTMTVAKLDQDLNLVWKRYCYEPLSFKYDPYSNMYSDMLNDGNGNKKGIYIVGYASHLMQAGAGIFHFFLTDDGLTTVQEGNVDIRPYAFYPNPAQDQLHLQYSPDVQPRQVELYDLQGRLVRMQNSGLENVDMQGLARGQYLMKVTLEDGKVYSDKVVKE